MKLIPYLEKLNTAADPVPRLDHLLREEAKEYIAHHLFIDV